MNLFTKASFCISIVILILAGGVLCACSSTATDPQPTPGPSIDNGVEVVYFHRSHRCYGCLYAGDKVRYTIDTYFADKLASGELVFMTINVQDDANAAIVNKYGAYTSSLFMNKVVDGVDHIEAVTGIWFLLGKDQEFVDLVKSEIEERLE
jgi:hypothetical protein